MNALLDKFYSFAIATGTVYTIVGSIVMIVIAVGLAALAIGFAAERIHRRNERFYWATRNQRARYLGARLINDSYWFSENDSARQLLLVLGTALTMDADYAIDKVRDEWRKATLKSRVKS